MIRNPVLTGFSPDPSILRVGEDHFLATSTFEWFPGVRLHHSRDLAHWRVLGHALTRATQLDLRGVADSAGVWAPALSHDGRQFWLVYSVVNTRRSWPLISVANFAVSAPHMDGPWSDPVFLDGSGWDPSLFHDDDGRSWLVHMLLDHRPGHDATAGIVLHEFSRAERRLIGEPTLVFRGTTLGCTEGPHLYKQGGRYYLMTAEGGTSWGHAVTVARSSRLEGPYEPDPAGPMLTSRGDPEAPLQKAGHGCLVTTATGESYVAHLCSRPMPGRQRSPLGRETALQRVHWTADGWLRLADGGCRPQLEVPAPALPQAPWPPPSVRDDFDDPRLSPEWQTLRAPAAEDWLSLRARPGHLRLRGREPLFSLYDQSLVARRWTSLTFTAATIVDVEPERLHQAAGLICWYDTSDWIYLRVGWDPQLGKHLAIDHSLSGRWQTPAASPIELPRGRRCRLAVSVNGEHLQFSWALEGDDLRTYGPVFDTGQLSDEHDDKHAFTGAFVGLAAQDMGARRLIADFDHLELAPHGRRN